MAEIVLNDVVDRLIANAFSLISIEDIGFESSFKAELKNLLETLFKIKFLLDDAQKRQSSDKSMRNWLMELRDVVYDADNVLDEFSYERFLQEVQTQNLTVDRVCRISFCNPDKVKTIKHLLDKIDKIVHDAVGFGHRMELVNSIPKISLDMKIDPFLDDSEVVGREYDVTKIVNVLISSSNQQVISVLPIVGMAGLGKTTLAKLVYNNELIKKHFDILAWVNVGKHFDVEGILREILKFLEGYLSDLEYDDILQKCAEKLREIKYFLILDDVQDEDLEKWDTLKANNIVVTTRSDNVAEIMETHPKHQLEKLSKDDCWSIIKKRIFINGRIPLTLDLEAIGREIAKRCGGIPLVARVLGGIMCFKFDKSKWLEIQNNKIWDLLDEDRSDIFPVLKLCFDHLPTPSLKRCFSYCAIFPKDYDMKKDEVIQYWMAEGFFELAKEANMVMEDIGNMYFNILLATSFFQNARKDAYGNIISCKMHDLMHDFALSISKSETLILEGDSVDNVSSIQPLFARFDGKTTLATSFSGDGFIKLRTLILENFNFDIMLSNFKSLRALKLSGHGMSDSIEQLIHLRLLHISQTAIMGLPESITKLYNLQTLRIEGHEGDGSFRQFSLPEDLSNLIMLRHIHINNFLHYRKTPKNMGRLTCLQTLSIFVKLGALKNLKGEIKIMNLEYVKDEEEAKSAKLKEKEILELGLYWNIFFNIADDRYDKDEKVLEGLQPHPNLKSLRIEWYGGKKFPLWVGLLLYQNLIEINLSCCTKCEEVPTLGLLPCLKVLEIEFMVTIRSIGSKFYCHSEGSYRNTTLFPALRILKLERMHSLVEWKDAKELTSTGEVLLVFPCLEELIIRWCNKLRDIPDSLHTCVSLQKLVVESCLDLRFLPGVASRIRYLEIIDCGIEELSSELQFCTFLQYLKIEQCWNLKSIPNSLHTCVSLQKLVVVNCTNLRYLPDVPSDILHLEIIDCGRLKTLVIGGFIEELDAFPILHYPSIQYSNASLKKLILLGRPTLNSLPNEIQHFTALEELQIQNFNGMEALPDWFSYLSSLQKLSLYYCKKLYPGMVVKAGCSLEELRIENFDGMEALPDWLGIPSSLQKLSLYFCQKLMCLPILRFTNLKHLYIAYCPNLEKRCANGSNAEWLKIAHIPNIKINGKYIQGGEDSDDSEDFDDPDSDEFDNSEDEEDSDDSEDDSYYKYIPFPTGLQFICVIFYF
ncbi:hypothetical protein RGQ29_002397 [Quercus rubra]|uniref:Uncharacterized protein n=1 Tax=Quercus rubra TaxID=3512 RepID=A0AAN7EA31_QUERU|nr:hypothetical protein RGQ29_002397 [Quercus rubra]